MANPVYVFDEATVRRIAAAVKDYERRTEVAPPANLRRYPRGVFDSIFPFILTEDIGNTTSGEASANKLAWDFTTVIATGITVVDNGGIFGGGLEDAYGLAIVKAGQNHIIQLGC